MDAETLGVMIPITAIVMGIGLAMLGDITTHRRRSQALEQRHRERMAAIEKGLDLPVDAPDPDAQIELAKALRKPRYLLRGLVLTSIGTALLLGWSGPAENLIRGIAFVVLAIGLATLLYHAVEGRKEKPSQLALPGSPDAEGQRKG